jgi:hypothetical protein
MEIFSLNLALNFSKILFHGVSFNYTVGTLVLNINLQDKNI